MNADTLVTITIHHPDCIYEPVTFKAENDWTITGVMLYLTNNHQIWCTVRKGTEIPVDTRET